MKTVLLIDDNPQILACLAGVLRVFGFRVMVADNGPTGLRALERSQPDVIVCAAEMPGLDGFGVLQQVRAHPVAASTPFIFLSGMSDPDGRQLAADLGAQDYLAKPIAPWELVEAIRRQLEGVPRPPLAAGVREMAA